MTREQAIRKREKLIAQLPSAADVQGYRRMRESLEAISELNQFLLRLEREEFKQRAAQA